LGDILVGTATLDGLVWADAGDANISAVAIDKTAFFIVVSFSALGVIEEAPRHLSV
jgi:hypothetical protein